MVGNRPGVSVGAGLSFSSGSVCQIGANESQKGSLLLWSEVSPYFDSLSGKGRRPLGARRMWTKRWSAWMSRAQSRGGGLWVLWRSSPFLWLCPRGAMELPLAMVSLIHSGSDTQGLSPRWFDAFIALSFFSRHVCLLSLFLACACWLSKLWI